mmetsp:Transcript_6148/g.12479  ORF Transcript_6148/g.12479 Transcript_6148/m.12479 type:complete len:303 (-) Transcript_6148:177-1085(-)
MGPRRTVRRAARSSRGSTALHVGYGAHPRQSPPHSGAYRQGTNAQTNGGAGGVGHLVELCLVCPLFADPAVAHGALGQHALMARLRPHLPGRVAVEGHARRARGAVDTHVRDNGGDALSHGLHLASAVAVSQPWSPKIPLPFSFGLLDDAEPRIPAEVTPHVLAFRSTCRQSFCEASTPRATALTCLSSLASISLDITSRTGSAEASRKRSLNSSSISSVDRRLTIPECLHSSLRSSNGSIASCTASSPGWLGTSDPHSCEERSESQTDVFSSVSRAPGGLPQEPQKPFADRGRGTWSDAPL